MCKFWLNSRAQCADNLGMSATTRPRSAAASFVIETETQHWRVHRGWVYRDCWVRLVDGTRRLYSIPESPVGVAA